MAWPEREYAGRNESESAVVWRAAEDRIQRRQDRWVQQAVEVEAAVLLALGGLATLRRRRQRAGVRYRGRKGLSHQGVVGARRMGAGRGRRRTGRRARTGRGEGGQREGEGVALAADGALELASQRYFEPLRPSARSGRLVVCVSLMGC